MLLLEHHHVKSEVWVIRTVDGFMVRACRHQPARITGQDHERAGWIGARPGDRVPRSSFKHDRVEFADQIRGDDEDLGSERPAWPVLELEDQNGAQPGVPFNQALSPDDDRNPGLQLVLHVGDDLVGVRDRGIGDDGDGDGFSGLGSVDAMASHSRAWGNGILCVEGGGDQEEEKRSFHGRGLYASDKLPAMQSAFDFEIPTCTEEEFRDRHCTSTLTHEKQFSVDGCVELLRCECGAVFVLRCLTVI